MTAATTMPCMKNKYKYTRLVNKYTIFSSCKEFKCTLLLDFFGALHYSCLERKNEKKKKPKAMYCNAIAVARRCHCAFSYRAKSAPPFSNRVQPKQCRERRCPNNTYRSLAGWTIGWQCEAAQPQPVIYIYLNVDCIWHCIGAQNTVSP